ncbi:tyrosine-protein phosphatase [Oecophyllibacter saccharovorans]|uniref:tyrosine-protein phosphatase n=1 Tax=Oecophyllibacter saccharovorans TaxID=2558360 RepID=UPI00116F7F9B|nr:tyrosine-protein phosphatase [Oecophyllibacter saccharovorans]TPW36315.1 protein tyrosine phosphatase [Oecophyllibacter saccharovorans]
MFKGPLSTPADRRRAWHDSLFADHAIFRLSWTNLACVVPGKVWRSNHPTPGRLSRQVPQLGLKTIINLRGKRDCGSDALARERAQALHLPCIDMAFESRNAPHKDRVLRFCELYRRLEAEKGFPLLMHCKSGADRAGLASGLVLLLEGGTVQQALAQLHWRHLHFHRSRTGVLDAFFLRYWEHLAGSTTPADSRLQFLDWVREEYDEEKLRAEWKQGSLRRQLPALLRQLHQA